MGFITELFNHYGYIVLFIALAIELIAFPTPGETLMTYCGFLVFQHKLNWEMSILTASLGVITGITTSYLIGFKLGTPFIQKYGTYIHMGPDKMDKTSKWFKKYGNGLLIIAYFIPGVRHITGYFSGITKIPFKRFAMNAYIGAFIWSSTFISLGKVLGTNWEKFHGSIKKYLIIGSIVTGLILLSVYLYRSYKQRIIEFIFNSLQNSLKIFHSMGKIRIAILGIAVAFIGLSILAVGLIQDFMENEFKQFDLTTAYLVSLIFPQDWSLVIKYFSFLTSYPTLILTTIMQIILIISKGKNKLLEIRFLLITVLGAEVLEELLRTIFRRLGPPALTIVGHAKYTFPGEQSLMAVATYGFAAFIILRHVKSRLIGTVTTFFILTVCFISGLAPLFLQFQYPSDVIAGYAFGGVWLCINILLLEVFRIVPEVNLKHS